MNEAKAAISTATAVFQGNGSAAGLISFGPQQTTHVLPAETLPSSNLASRLQALTAIGWTNWQDGLSAAETAVVAATKKPLVLFITDGAPNAMGSPHVRTNPGQTMPAAIPHVAGIRAAGSRVIGIGIGLAIPTQYVRGLLGTNVVTVGPNTTVDPFNAEVIMIPDVTDSLNVFTQIAEAYCPGAQASSRRDLSHLRQALENIPASRRAYSGDDEPMPSPSAGDVTDGAASAVYRRALRMKEAAERRAATREQR